MKYVVYTRKGQKYKILKLDNLGVAHKEFNSIKEYDYKELAIDKLNSYRLIRKLYKQKKNYNQ